MAISCRDVLLLAKSMSGPGRIIKVLLLALFFWLAGVATLSAQDYGVQSLSAPVGVPESLTFYIDGLGEFQVNWLDYIPVVALFVALSAFIFNLYQRRKRLSDIKSAEIVKKRADAEHAEVKKSEQHKTDDERYRERLKEELHKNTIFGMPGIDGDKEAVDLPDTFVPLDISVNEVSRPQRNQRGTVADGGAGYNISDVTPEGALEYAVPKSRMLLIIGEPGSGKTTILKHFALSSHIKLPGFTFPVPMLYMPLSKMVTPGEEQQSLPEKLSHCFEPHLKIAETFFEERLHKHRSLVLLDGLDEISDREQRVKVCRWISEAAKTWSKAFFVVTTRDKGYGENEQLALKINKQVAYVKRFTIAQQSSFLQKWFRAAFLRDLSRDQGADDQGSKSQTEQEAARSATALESYLSLPENKGLRDDLAGIPLLLQLMAILWKQSKAIPESREALYRVALDYLLFYRENEKNIPPFLPASESKKLLEPVSLWMQDMNEDAADTVKFHARMQQEVDLLDYKYRSKYSAEEICDNLVTRAGVLGRSGSAYVFSHKTFREYLAGLRLVKCVTSEPDRMKKLVEQVGVSWWDEPLLFFVAQVDPFWFNEFMRAFFDSPKSESLDQSTLNFLQKLIRKAPQTVDTFCEKLRDPATSRSRQYSLLECLKTVGNRQAVDAAQIFKQQHPTADRELLRKADEVVLTDEQNASVALGGDHAVELLDAFVDPVIPEGELFFSKVEQGAQYILIRNRRYFMIGKKDLYVAKYPVTNKLYRKFVAYLQVIENKQIDSIVRSRLLECFGEIWGVQWYLDEEPQLSKRFQSRYNDDRRFKDDDQPVVGVSWYDASAYCLWLSLLESNGQNPDIYRLPTVMEWEYAAIGKEKREYPWLKEKGLPASKIANFGNNVGTTTPVGSYPEGATPEGLYDMAGNVWEWTANKCIGNDYTCLLAGGSWNVEADALRVSSHIAVHQRNWDYCTGFRVIRSSHSSPS